MFLFPTKYLSLPLVGQSVQTCAAKFCSKFEENILNSSGDPKVFKDIKGLNLALHVYALIQNNVYFDPWITKTCLYTLAVSVF